MIMKLQKKVEKLEQSIAPVRVLNFDAVARRTSPLFFPALLLLSVFSALSLSPPTLSSSTEVSPTTGRPSPLTVRATKPKKQKVSPAAPQVCLPTILSLSFRFFMSFSLWTNRGI